MAKGAVADTAELLRSLGHETVQRDPEWGGIGNNITPRYLHGIAEDVATACPAPSASNAAPRASVASAV